MVAMTASGWEAAGAVNILQTFRPAGPGMQRRALVQLVLSATNFGNGAHLYPSGNGIPLPAPTLVGFREYISYVIPLGPFAAVGLNTRHISWGAVPPSGGASGSATPAGSPLMRVAGLMGATPSGGPTYQLEAVTTLAASTLFTTNAMQANAIFVGK